MADQAARWAFTSGSVALKLRKLRFEQIVKLHKFSFGEYLEKVDDINDRSCRSEPGGRAGCRSQGQWTNSQLEKMVNEVLGRIDESWTSKKKPGRFGFNDEKFEIAFDLAKEGKSVVARGDHIPAPGSEGDRKTFDAWADGQRWEFKSLESDQRKRIVKEIFSADAQGADVAFVRLRVGESMARSAVNAVVNSQQKANALTAIRMQGDGYDFTVTLRK
ncbi:hypothetical protein AB0K92_26180 [Streptomyces sp. NPDC052687]|uniref:hypothetical protein n=1 Tax=Streptomyces sp. NPDC052687 TaxID=3154759 RepID=UPI0034464033